MIEQHQILQILLEACPSFRQVWDEVNDYGEELIYPALGAFVSHLLELHRSGRTEEFKAVGEAIERLEAEGSAFTKEAATIGILEGIQNVWANRGVDPEAFRPFLGAKSTFFWQSLEDFWAGKVPYVGFRG